MNSVFPNLNYPNTTGPKSKEQVVFHYHKIEIVNSKPSNAYDQSLSPTRIEAIKRIVADILICLGSLMGLVAGMAFALQSAGVASPALPILANLLMPAIAVILAGSHLSKTDLKGKTNLRIATGIPGLTLSS